LFDAGLSSKIAGMGKKRSKKKMGRPPKPTAKVKSGWIAFAVEPARAAAYRKAAEKAFEGVMRDFARAACDDLAARLNATETQLKRERQAFRSGTDDAAEQFERDAPGTHER
jgi:hypothetical protein